MSQNFEDLNDHIIFTNVDSQSEAFKIRDEAKQKSSQKTVVVFYENTYHLYLAPMQDPYQIRKEVDQWMDQNKTDKKSTTKPSSDDSSKTTKAKVLKVKW